MICYVLILAPKIPGKSLYRQQAQFFLIFVKVTLHSHKQKQIVTDITRELSDTVNKISNVSHFILHSENVITVLTYEKPTNLGLTASL